jgi:hypothetical protein
MCLLGLAWLAGCDRSQMAESRLGPARGIVSASVENLGWGKVFGGSPGSVSFAAIVTTYDRDGQKYADRQKMVVDLGANTIAARGATPQGTWTARAGQGGLSSIDAEPRVDAALIARRMGMVLPVLLHRLRGPYNLLEGAEAARSPQNAQVGGVPVIRVGVTGDNRQAIAYYFGPATGILKYVTAGADSPGGSGAVTGYEYRSLANGATFPSLIQVNRIGGNVLLGETPVFQVEISDVKF